MTRVAGCRAIALGAVVALALAVVAPSASAQADPEKVLRVVFPVAETGVDPQASSDVYSNHVIRAMFDAPYRYDQSNCFGTGISVLVATS